MTLETRQDIGVVLLLETERCTWRVGYSAFYRNTKYLNLKKKYFQNPFSKRLLLVHTYSRFHSQAIKQLI